MFRGTVQTDYFNHFLVALLLRSAVQDNGFNVLVVLLGGAVQVDHFNFLVAFLLRSAVQDNDFNVFIVVLLRGAVHADYFNFLVAFLFRTVP